MRCECKSADSKAFSLVELLISMAILSLMILMVSFMLGEVEKGWSRVRGGSIEFRDARNAFETIANRISQARIDTYWDYEMDGGLPVQYRKSSHLHFVAGPAEDLVPDSLVEASGSAIFFEAPFGISRQQDLKGLASLLNGWGYFAGFSGDVEWQPLFARGAVADRYRFRLFEYHLPTEELVLHSEDTVVEYDWITNHLVSENVSVLAENIILFLIHPVDSTEPEEAHKLAEQYRFDSRAYSLAPELSNAARTQHEIPPMIKMTMVAVSEGDFGRLQGGRANRIPVELQFEEIAPFEKAADFEKDLHALEEHLQEERVDYRVFSTVISLRASKWTDVNF
ncbi:MAG: Verru_Chthon cassette protein C [Verrucomicrobiales bacterium]|nr:Verru_Chthon cassette protein C [Verrucomicrobiales bacterium]